MHKPVMAREAAEFLKIGSGSVVLDATIGFAGHAESILEQITPEGLLIGVDADREALSFAEKRLSRYKHESYKLIQGNFRDIDRILPELGIERLDGALFDLGVSSYQLEKPERGFSFERDGLLDMRMDQAAGVRAYDIINRCKSEDLEKIIREFGEERYYRAVARAIVEQRGKGPIKTTTELKELLGKVLGKKYRTQKIHCATRTFQALRIAVNEELESLKAVIPKLWDFLNSGGRACFISFHSLEDRIVKQAFKSLSREDKALIITKKPLTASSEEKSANPRSRSAKMRVAEKK